MINNLFPLHPAQYEIYVDQLINPASPHYNIGFYLKLSGFLNKEKFIQAVNSSPEVFDVFKIRFDLDDLNPFCYLDENYDKLEVKEMDWSGRDNSASEAKLWMQQQFNLPFSLEKGNLFFETVLIKISSDEHWFFFKYHHLITDAYGFTIWINYLCKKYKSLLGAKSVHFSYPYVQETQGSHPAATFPDPLSYT